MTAGIAGDAANGQFLPKLLVVKPTGRRTPVYRLPGMGQFVQQGGQCCPHGLIKVGEVQDERILDAKPVVLAPVLSSRGDPVI